MPDTPPPLQTHLIHAAAYSSIFLEMVEHLFPGRKIPALTEDERRIAQNETDNLLTRSRWRLESNVFLSSFGTAVPLPPDQVIPDGTVLGPRPSQAGQTKPPGQYV
jgi:hypothetical protein